MTHGFALPLLCDQHIDGVSFLASWQMANRTDAIKVFKYTHTTVFIVAVRELTSMSAQNQSHNASELDVCLDGAGWQEI